MLSELSLSFMRGVVVEAQVIRVRQGHINAEEEEGMQKDDEEGARDAVCKSTRELKT